MRNLLQCGLCICGADNGVVEPHTFGPWQVIEEASVSAAAEAESGIFTCEVKSSGTGRATLIAAQYVDGRMVDLRISDVVIDLGVGGKVSFSFKPADGAEYKAYLLYEGAMIPVC